MQSVIFTRKVLQTVVRLARQHAVAWAESRSTPDGIERAFNAAELRGEHVELWHAVHVRIAMLNVAVPAAALWDRNNAHTYDELLDEAWG